MKIATTDEIKRSNDLEPMVGKVVKILEESTDVKTFRISTLDGKKPFAPKPGQLGMFSLPMIGEAMFSVTNQGDDYIDMAIKKTGELTDALHEIEEGQEIGIRGPYGNGFPLEYLKGKDIVFIAGGIGLAPVRSVIMHCLKNRADYGKLTIIYGARSVEDLCFKDDLFNNWPKEENTQVYVTIDRPQEGWEGHVGFVPDYIKEIAPNPQIAIICGPPVMIKFSLPALTGLGFQSDDVITTLELRMKCGIGKCGRCNIGHKYVCLDGPVFTLTQLNEMPNEY
ncbi:MAG: hydrogenase [Clostridiales bacterium]|nr:MAG: hydrogenase [Clostridiales bacterium]